MKTKNIGKILLNNAIIIMIIASAIFVGIQRPNFFSLTNLKNLMSNTSVRFVIALGISGCLIMRNNDLSAARQVGFAGCLAATLLQRADYPQKVFPNLPEMNMWVVMILLMVGFALVFGIINGLIVGVFKVPAFIGTYGMQTVVYGICLVFTGAQPIGGLIESIPTCVPDRCSASSGCLTWPSSL